MYNLIQITESNGQKAVSARELHTFLEVSEKFTDWSKRMFEYGFEEQKDFIRIIGKSTGGRPSLDYALTIRTAKEISMLQRSEKGKEARNYFLDIEERANKPKTQIEIILESAQQLLEIEKRQSTLEQKVFEIENKHLTTPQGMTIIGYATICKLKCNLVTASLLGRKAKKLAKDRNIVLDTIKDVRWGLVNVYPENLLQEVFAEFQIQKSA